MNKKQQEENFLKNIDLKNVSRKTSEKAQKSPVDPDNGKNFLKITDSQKKDLNSTDRVALNRKGNQFFNEGKIEVARRIFITTGYSDGLSRVGDHYYKNNNYLEALKMYSIAPAPDKKDELIKKISNVIIRWIN
ncbi:MAG: hypothetical protein FWF38_01125 [Spirochaetaceae bacterium]|nr:hypothetical protein [Spirochaetaceae bacterium]